MPTTAQKQLTPQINKLGILAGAGNIPQTLIRYCKDQAIQTYVVGFEGQCDLNGDSADLIARLGEAGKVIKSLKNADVSDLVLIGRIRRPSLSELKPDLKTAEFFAKEGLNAIGDDGLLKALKRFLEKEGFALHGVHTIMPELLSPEGDLTKIKASKQHERDIARGCRLLDILGEQDVGQSVVVQQGHILGVEGAEGTDELIRRCAGLQRKGDKAVLVKLSKKGQDHDLDLPTIGPQTIQECVDAGFAGLAVHAGLSLFEDREEAVQTGNKAKIFIKGIQPERYLEM